MDADQVHLIEQVARLPGLVVDRVVLPVHHQVAQTIELPLDKQVLVEVQLCEHTTQKLSICRIVAYALRTIAECVHDEHLHPSNGFHDILDRYEKWKYVLNNS